MQDRYIKKYIYNKQVKLINLLRTRSLVSLEKSEKDFFDLIKVGKLLNSVAPLKQNDLFATSRFTFGI